MARTIQARRKLSALYERGIAVRFGPGQDEDDPPVVRYGDQKDGTFADPEGPDEVTAWVMPPSPLQREMAMRDAQATRAKTLLRVMKEKESGDSLSVQVFVADMEDETLVDYLLLADSEERNNEATRDILAQDEWKNITELQDAFAQYEDENGRILPDADPEDPEYKLLLEAEVRLHRQISEHQAELTETTRDALHQLPRAEWERRATEKRSEMVGSQSFMKEYERQMVFYSVRDPEDHGVLFYESAKELASEPDEIQSAFATALARFIQDGRTAKNSLRAVDGSPQSTPPSEPETSEASTPQDVSA